jgi:flagellar motor switch protein FliM
MEEKVSTEELDALFGDEESEEGQAAADPEPGEEGESTTDDVAEPAVDDAGVASTNGRIVKSHDWGEKRRLSNDQIRTLNDMHDQFAKSYGPALGIALKREVMMTMEGEPKQISYGEYIGTLPNPTSLTRFVLPPLEGTAVLHLDLKLALAIVERVLGGRGDPVDDEDVRPATAIEEKVVQRVMGDLLQALRAAWIRVVDFDPTFTTAESIPYYLQLSQMADDIVIAVDFKVVVSDEFGVLLEGDLSVCYPYILIQPIASSLKASQLFGSSSGASLSDEIRNGLEKVKAPIRCNLVRDKLRLQDLLEMEIGDVLTFRTNLEQAAEVVIGKTSVFWGRPGTLGRRYTVRVESFISPDDQSPSTLEDVAENVLQEGTGKSNTIEEE